jgi:integrase/recombinase XerC
MDGAEALTAWLDTLARERRASPNTVEAYRADLSLFLGFLTRHLGEVPELGALAALRPADLRAFLAERAREGDGNATRARRLAAVRGFIRYLARRHGGSTAPIAGLRGPRAKAAVPRALAADAAKDVARGIGTVHDPDRAMQPAMQAARDVALFTLLYGCGLRISEALGLDVRDAPLPGAEAALRIRGKGGKERLVPVLPAVREASGLMRRWRSGASGSIAASPACRNMRRRMRCAIPSPPICSAAGPICGRSRNCWAMPACPPRSAIRGWTPPGCWRRGARRIRGPIERLRPA